MIPSLFIAHGAPLLAVENNDYTQFLNENCQGFPRPKAIILFSAHWESRVQQVGDVEKYSTIHDFGGFDQALYNIQYPAPGDHEVAKKIEALLTKKGLTVETNDERGLDHGAWVVLRLLYPNADIPVISMSVSPGLTPNEQYEIGKALSALRAEDVLIIGSGGTVHNLRAVNWHDNGQVDSWALEFDEWLASHLKKWDLPSLFKYDKLAPNAGLAVPPYGREHFVPIFYAMGAADDDQKATLLHRSYRYGNLSHSVWQFGSAAF